jgi:AbiV family abortive infection protein
MTPEKPDLEARREELRKFFSKPVTLSDKDNQLLAELVRGAEVCFANAEQLFQEASLLREHKHFARSVFLHQIAMEDCAKVDMIGAAATALTLGHPVDLERVAKSFRDHKAKNFSNAYMAKASEAEMAARKANDNTAASEAFKNSQREIHGFLNAAKNASMYVDFKEGKFVSPDEVVSEKEALLIAGLSYYFMSVTYPRLKPLRRMLEEPHLHAELMAGFGEAMLKGLGDQGTMEDVGAAINSYIKEMASRLAAREKSPPNTTEPKGGSMTIPKKAPIWSAALAAVSVLLAVAIRLCAKGDWQDALAKGLVGAWALGAPVWFIVEWHYFESADKDDLEQFKYSQKLAATVWVALVVVLAAITGIKWGG